MKILQLSIKEEDGYCAVKYETEGMTLNEIIGHLEVLKQDIYTKARKTIPSYLAKKGDKK